MAKHMDSEDVEVPNVMKLCSFKNKDILEIGCGDGRLSIKYAGKARHVTAIDPNDESIATARRNLPKNLATKISFAVRRGEELGDYRSESFDIVFFSWSLCCTDIPVMGRALDEAWRVLRRGGTLINLQPSLFQPFDQGALTYLVKKRFGTSVDVENYRQARFALKYKSLIEGMFDFVAEKEFPVTTLYETVRDAVEDLATGAREQYESLSARQKRHIRGELEGRDTGSGIVSVENALLTVLRKRENGAGGRVSRVTRVRMAA